MRRKASIVFKIVVFVIVAFFFVRALGSIREAVLLATSCDAPFTELKINGFKPHVYQNISAGSILLEWSSIQAAEAVTFNMPFFRRYTEGVKPAFTPQGWAEFMVYLAKMGYGRVTEENFPFSFRTAPSPAPVALDAAVKEGKCIWHVRVFLDTRIGNTKTQTWTRLPQDILMTVQRALPAPNTPDSLLISGWKPEQKQLPPQKP